MERYMMQLMRWSGIGGNVLIVVKSQDLDGCWRLMLTNIVIEGLLFDWFILQPEKV